MSSISDSSINKNTDTSAQIREFFDRDLNNRISLSSNQVDSIVGFFKKRGFEESAAISVSTVILQQAKKDNTNIFKIIDTLNGLTNVQLSDLVATILNNNRSKISNIGYTNRNTSTTREQRNIRL